MGFGITSEQMLKGVIWGGIGVLVLTLLFALQLMLLRALLIVRQRRRERFLTRWRPLLMQSLEAVPPSVPPIARADVYTFLSLWNYLHESLLATTKDQLNELARLTEVDKIARQMLRQRSLRQRLMAIVTLGHLRDAAVWESLQTIAGSSHTVLALAAARALMQINASAALPFLLPLIATRQDWPMTRIMQLLKEAGADVVSQPLAQALLTIAPASRPRLIRYLTVAHGEVALPLIREWLQTSEDERVLHACLPFINDPADVVFARACLTHPQWLVRMQAAVALGRVGAEQDQAQLIALLEDPQWWVRYRAAQSLVHWPFGEPTRLAPLAHTHPNPFAREILTHALAERTMQEALPR